MTEIKLIGLHVILKISDPWEFGTECGIGPFKGLIKDIDLEHMLIKLENPIYYQGKKLTIAVCRPRHKGKNNKDILNGEQLSVNILLLSSKVDILSKIDKSKSMKSTSVIGTVESASPPNF